MHRWLDEILALEEQPVQAALATVVSARGSTPREAGARMLIFRDGRLSGTIGGGCGEAEVRKAALDVMDTGAAKLITIDLSGFFGDEQEVCGGRMEVFIEPVGQGPKGLGEEPRER
jgi:Xanthine and CO dehydrogenases maturation factor, XdhC/CoxF family